MRKILPRVLVVLILMIKAATVVIPDFTPELLIMAAVPLTVLSIVLFARRGVYLSAQLPWVACAAAVIFFVLPLGPAPEGALDRIFVTMLEAFGDVLNDGLGSVGLLVLLVTQVLLRKKNNLFLILIRYLAVGVILLGMSYEVFYYTDAYSMLVVVVVVCSFLREACAYLRGGAARSLLRCVLTMLFFFLIGSYSGGVVVADHIGRLFRTDSGEWVITTVVVFITGLLVLMDDYGREGVTPEKIFKERNVGWVMLIWCVMNVVMNVWPVLMHPAIVYLGIPLMVLMANTMISEIQGSDYNWPVVFAAIWSGLALVLLMLAKSMNMDLLLLYVLLAALVFVYFNWKKLLGGSVSSGLLSKTMGVFAVVSMATMFLNDLDQLRYDPQWLLGIILICAMWLIACGYTEKLEKSASDVYKEEFVPVARIRMAVSVAVLAMAVFKILFVL